jgi:parallel beta-helix repeat protein
MVARGSAALVGVSGALLVTPLTLIGGADSAWARACDEVAAPGSRPDRFARSLRAGEVGCFRSGKTYRSLSHPIKIARPGITLRSTAGGARAKIVGRLWVTRQAHDATVHRLSLIGTSESGLPSPTVNGNVARFTGNVVTNDHQGICFILGNTNYGVARGIEIAGNRIHGCGELPATNRHHGIYLAHTRGTVIRNNVIYGNADRGIQLYPDADGTTVTGNVIDGNGQGIIFGGDRESHSDNNVVTENVITYSQLRYNVEAHWQGSPGSGNVVARNCVWAPPGSRLGLPPGSGIQESPKGFLAFGNRVAEPQYVSRSRADYRLQPSSRCRGLR